MIVARRCSVRLVCVLAFAMAEGCGGGGGSHDAAGPPPLVLTGTTRVSVGAAGEQADQNSVGTTISGDGRVVAFVSQASNLTPEADPGCQALGCLYVRDLTAGTTARVPTDAVAAFGPALSYDGRWLAFTAQIDVAGGQAVLVYDRATGVTEPVDVRPDGAPSRPQGTYLTFPAIAADGRYVAFGSAAADLVAGDTNGVPDVFVRDRLRRTTERVSVSSRAAEANATSGFFIGPALSADGRFVAFKSAASNLVPDDHNDGARCPEGDGCADVFVRDRVRGTTERVNLASDGTEANGTSSINIPLAISANGRYVAFSSNATNLVAGDLDLGVDFFDGYRYDRQARVIERVSVAADGGRADATSVVDGISADGRFVALVSAARNLLPGALLQCDRDPCGRVFVRDPATATTTVANVTIDGSVSRRSTGAEGALSADGRLVAFSDVADDLVSADTNGAYDVFVRALR